MLQPQSQAHLEKEQVWFTEKDAGGASTLSSLQHFDEHQTLQSTLKEAEGKGISVVVTNRQFEQWLYWHLHDDDGGDEKSMMRKLRKDGLLVGEKDKELGAKFPVSNYPKAVGRAQRLWPTMKVNAHLPH